MRNTKLNITDYKKITQFILLLEKNQTATWKDKYGDYKIFIGTNIIKSVLGKDSEYKLFKADSLTKNFDNLIQINEKSEKIVSIGSFQTHNIARNTATIQNKELITIPVPISNDSFGTNRYNNNNPISIKGVFPNMTIFDLEIIQTIDFRTNILGIGEFIGLYYSILDYSYCNKKEFSKIIKDIKKRFIQICDTISNSNKLLINISISLIYKCLIMRINSDHTIGCGIDHLFANVLEKRNNLAHGKAVYLGAIISSIIIPNWGKYGIDTKFLIENGQKINLISYYDLSILKAIDILQLIESAIKTRPNRKTILHDIDKSIVKKRWFNSIIN